MLQVGQIVSVIEICSSGFGQSALGEQVRAIAPECYAQAETQDNFRDRKVFQASAHVSRVLEQFEG